MDCCTSVVTQRNVRTYEMSEYQCPLIRIGFKSKLTGHLCLETMFCDWPYDHGVIVFPMK